MPSRARNPIFMAIIFFAILFAGYFLFQANDYIFGPKLSLAFPIEGETVYGSVDVKGKTEPLIRLTINGYETYSNDSGFFSEELKLGKGFHIIDVVVKNSFGREARISRSIIVK
ncbi:hypothetical protein ACFL3E_01670 [Patescibacteria group bacterium]